MMAATKYPTMTRDEMIADLIRRGLDPDEATIAGRARDGRLVIEGTHWIEPVRKADDPDVFPEIDADATRAREIDAVAAALAGAVTRVGSITVVSLTGGSTRWDEPGRLRPTAYEEVMYAPGELTRDTHDYLATHCAELVLVKAGPRFYVLNEVGIQVEESPFATREGAEAWVRSHGWLRPTLNQPWYEILTEAEMDEIERGDEDQ